MLHVTCFLFFARLPAIDNRPYHDFNHLLLFIVSQSNVVYTVNKRCTTLSCGNINLYNKRTIENINGSVKNIIKLFYQSFLLQYLKTF